MAVVSSSPKPTSPSPKERPQVLAETKKEKKRKEMKSSDVGSTSQGGGGGGIRLVGNRIYDPLNGKTCHQCRQKTMDFSASCKNMKGEKQCTIKFCHKCLLNRYGERAEDVSLLEDWKCPKCRDICNCSFCMKKKGQKPTGQLFHKAKENGFSSVSELLKTKSLESLDELKAQVAFDKTLPPNAKLKKSEITKREGLKEISNEIGDDAKNVGECGLKKARVASNGDVKLGINKVGFAKTKNRKTVSDNGFADAGGNGKLDTVKHSGTEGSKGMTNKDGRVPNGLKDHGQPLMKSHKANMLPVEPPIKKVEPQIPLPSGTPINVVAGIDFSPEDVGNALQFLEFCAAFGKALNLKKGQPEAAMKEMAGLQREQRSQYRSQQSVLTQIHVRLLNMIQRDVLEESETLRMKNLKNTWFQALGEFVSECEFISKEFPSENFERGNEAYGELKVSEKLKLLNFLCDEALNTDALRSWIDDANSKFLERQKKAKEKVSVAREKERQLRQKMNDEVVKALIERNGVPLSISEHDALLLDIKNEVAEAHEEMDRALGVVHRWKPISDAVRTGPALSDVDGRVFWRLNCGHGLSDILLQDLSNRNCESPDEKWFCYAIEQKEEVEKYICGMNRRRVSLGRVEAA